MYLSPKSSSSSICLLRDWARSHLYSLPGLTIATPQINCGLFLTVFILKILCFTKNRTSTTRYRLCKNHQISELQQSTRMIALFAEISNSAITNKSTSPLKTSTKILMQTLFRTQVYATRPQASRLARKIFKIFQSHLNFLKFCKHIKFQTSAINANDRSVRGNFKFQ